MIPYATLANLHLYMIQIFQNFGLKNPLSVPGDRKVQDTHRGEMLPIPTRANHHKGIFLFCQYCTDVPIYDRRMPLSGIYIGHIICFETSHVW